MKTKTLQNNIKKETNECENSLIQDNYVFNTLV